MEFQKVINNNNDCEYSIFLAYNQNDFEYLKNNPNIQSLDNSIKNHLITFLQNYELGKNLLLWFDLYIEDSLVLGRQLQYIDNSSKTIRTSCHLKKNLFDSLSKNEQIAIVFKSFIEMLESIKIKENISKYFELDKIIESFTAYYNTNFKKYKLDYNNIIIRNLCNLHFGFELTTTTEVDNSVPSGIHKIQEYLNTHIYHNNYGSSIYYYVIGMEIYDFDGNFTESFKSTKNYMRYGPKKKNILIVKQIDNSHIKNLNKKEQFRVINEKIKESFVDYKSLKRKPRDFKIDKLFDDISNGLDLYYKNNF